MALNLTGKVFGDLIVLRKSGRYYQKASGVWRTTWLCKCLCGKSVHKITNALTSGSNISCGCCEWQIHHRDSYISWMGMKSRCDSVTNKDYLNYGGRGIGYDPYWTKFENFYRDMGDPPINSISGERLSLDRIDNNGNYSKINCRWATRSQQQLNKIR